MFYVSVVVTVMESAVDVVATAFAVQYHPAIGRHNFCSFTHNKHDKTYM